jgi:hypothetical protein
MPRIDATEAAEIEAPVAAEIKDQGSERLLLVKPRYEDLSTGPCQSSQQRQLAQFLILRADYSFM